LGTNGDADFLFGKPHPGIHSASQQAGDGAEGTEPSVGHEEIILVQSTPKILEEAAFVSAAVTVSRFKQSSGKKAEKTDELERGKTTARLLTLTLRPASLVLRSIRHGDASSIDHPDTSAMPKLFEGDVVLEAFDDVGINIVDDIEGNLGASLTISARIRTRGKVLFPGKLSARKGHDLANGFPTGTLRSLNLIEKAPEDDIEGKKHACGCLLQRAVDQAESVECRSQRACEADREICIWKPW